MRNKITMSMLGHHGRWGNCLFQYAFLRIYAKKWGLRVETAPWAGEDIFGIEQSPVSSQLPPWHEPVTPDHQPLENQPPPGREICNMDFRGYAQYHSSFYAPHQTFIRELYRPVRYFQDRTRDPVRKLTSIGKTVIGIHLRRGDYGRLEFYVTPVSWYLDWLDANWSRFADPVLFIATETPSLVSAFEKYRPVTTETLGVNLNDKPMANYPYLNHDLRAREPWQMDFFYDWWFLSKCNVLVTPNSSYSFTAGMVSDDLREFWRSSLAKTPGVRSFPPNPGVSMGAFEKLDLWDTIPLTHDRAEDYRHLEGVCLDETPYWKRLADGTFLEK